MNTNTIEFNEFTINIQKIKEDQYTLLRHVFIAIEKNRTIDKSYYIESNIFIDMSFNQIIKLLNTNIKLSIVINNNDEWYGSDIISDIRLKNNNIFFRPATILREIVLSSKTSSKHSYLKYILFNGIRYKQSLLFLNYLDNLKDTQLFTLTINEFKNILELKDTQYKNFNALKSAVIDKIVEDVNSKTPYHLTVIKNTQPNRKKIISLTFTYYNQGLNND